MDFKLWLHYSQKPDYVPEQTIQRGWLQKARIKPILCVELLKEHAFMNMEWTTCLLIMSLNELPNDYFSLLWAGVTEQTVKDLISAP